VTQRGPATLGEVLHKHRSRAGLTQQELARRAGLSVRAVRNIERGGIGQPRQESVRRLAVGLGLSDTERDQLVAYTDEQRLPALLRVELLGPLAVWRGDIRVDQGGGLRRRLLAALALRLGHTVSRDELIDLLWDSSPPRTAASALHVCVGQLRAMLEPSRAPGGLPEVVIRVHDGYRLDLGNEQVDLTRFDHGLALARGLRGTAALDQYDHALGLWRGPVLADCGDRLRTHPAAVAATGRRIAAVCAAADLAVAEGQPTRAVPWLRGMLAEEPLHEGLHARLILALSASGGRAEALGHYTRARRTLIDELGVEPGPELRAAHGAALGQDRAVPEATADTGVPEPGAATEAAAPGPQLQALHQQILGADPLRTAHGSGSLQPEPAQVVPRQLPPSTRHFVGRADALKALNVLRTGAARNGNTMALVVICGTAGVGKTALAVHWAHQAARHFGGGQLYVNLRGFDASGNPVTPGEAIRGFLEALGIPADRIPASQQAQVGLYRSLLASQEMLIILDNASDADQVRPLLPAAAGCLVIVTSRNQLGGLAAAEGAGLVALDVLTAADAHDLLSRRIGTRRVSAEPGAVAELTRLCARLPLALSIAAARVAARPGHPLAELTAELADSSDRLDVLDIGDSATDVRAVFSWSYQQLTTPAARMFRLLSTHPGPGISAPAAASLAALPLRDARRALSELARGHLLAEPLPGRYACHDLLRAYAAERAGAVDGDDGRRAAIHRMLDHYLHTACAADRLLNPHRHATISPASPRAGVLPEDLADQDQAQSWFATERQALLAAMAHASSTGFDMHAWQIPWALRTFLDRQGHWHDLATAHRVALAAAERLGDREAQAHSHRYLGMALTRLGSHGSAQAHLQHALDLYEQDGSHAYQGLTRFSMAEVAEAQGRDYYGLALGHARHALGAYGAANDPVGQAMALNNICWYSAHTGDSRTALRSGQQALGMFNDLDHQPGKAHTYNSLGYAYLHLGQHVEALACYEQSLRQFRALGDRYGQARSLTQLGAAQHAAANPGAAHDAWQQALTILDDLNHPDAAQVRARLQGGGNGGPAVAGPISRSAPRANRQT
jgi:DNA-binding SARP family transcriptional activator/tetratricopeptide (TPR) repeat protein